MRVGLGQLLEIQESPTSCALPAAHAVDMGRG